jgi:probable phosphomutase (TIGR03848 family)
METTYLLIRHAATSHLGHIISGRSPGVHLNGEGREQADALVVRLCHIPVRAIYSSPLERAQETARPLAAHLGMDIQVSEKISEFDFGEWTGMRLDHLTSLPLWRQFNSFRSGTRAPGGELIMEVQARIVAELDRLRNLHDGQTIAIFSHADVIKYALAYYAGIPLDLACRIELYPASVSVLVVSEFAPRLIAINHTDRPLLS